MKPDFFPHNHTAKELLDHARARGAGVMKTLLTRYYDDVWAISVMEDEGLFVRMSSYDEFLATRKLDVPAILDISPFHTSPRPTREGLVSPDRFDVVLGENVVPCTWVGRIAVQSRFVTVVEKLHPSARWFVPECATERFVHAVVNGATVAFMAGIKLDFEAVTKTHGSDPSMN